MKEKRKYIFMYSEVYIQGFCFVLLFTFYFYVKT